jgi:hypothetical protein
LGRQGKQSLGMESNDLLLAKTMTGGRFLKGQRQDEHFYTGILNQ